MSENSTASRLVRETAREGIRACCSGAVERWASRKSDFLGAAAATGRQACMTIESDDQPNRRRSVRGKYLVTHERSRKHESAHCPFDHRRMHDRRVGLARWPNGARLWRGSRDARLTVRLCFNGAPDLKPRPEARDGKTI